MLKQVLFGSSFWQAVCFTIMQNGTSSFMTSAHDALVFVQVCGKKEQTIRRPWLRDWKNRAKVGKTTWIK